MQERQTKVGQAYFALNQAVNNFAWVRTNIFATEQQRREVILENVAKLKLAAENFLEAFAQESSGGYKNENEGRRRNSATDT